jgi:hypothetical protein
MTRDEILDALEDSREKFLDAIEGLPDEAIEEPGVVGDWSVKDILSHLIAWEGEIVKLMWQARNGEKPTTLHFAHVDMDRANADFYTATKDRPLERVLADFAAVRKQTERRVEAFSDKDLNDPQRYPWLGETPLWQWIAGDSFEHEAEHAAEILAWRQEKGLSG